VAERVFIEPAAFCYDVGYWSMGFPLGALEVKEHADGHEC
jgi:hypothetical protein